MSAPMPASNSRPGSYIQQPQQEAAYPSQAQQTYDPSPQPSPYQHYQYPPFPNQQQPQQRYQTTPQYTSTSSVNTHLNPNDAVIPHPAHQHATQTSNSSLQPYQQPQYGHPQQPPYERQASHQSQRSHHSHHSQHSHHSHHEDEKRDRELEHRPSFGDTLVLVWNTVVGAVSGKRR